MMQVRKNIKSCRKGYVITVLIKHLRGQPRACILMLWIMWYTVKVKVKLKFTLQQATKTKRGS